MIDKQTEGHSKEKLCKTKDHAYFFQVKYDTEGTTLITVLQEQRNKNDLIEDDKTEKSEVKTKMPVNSTGQQIEIGFKGLGISFIDNKPQELLYLCIDEIDIYLK